MVLSKYSQVEKLINKSDLHFDVILMDRFCAEGGSFHVLDIRRFCAKKINAISSSSACNDELKNLGVKRIINKDIKKLDDFASELSFAITGVVPNQTAIGLLQK